MEKIKSLARKLQKSLVIGICNHVFRLNKKLEEHFENNEIPFNSIEKHVVRECEPWMKCQKCEKIWCCSECAIEDDAWNKLRRKKSFICLKCKKELN